MALYNTEHSYGIITKSFHWTIALLVLVMIFLGFFMGYASKPLSSTLYTLHKSIGLTILLLMILRICWRAGNNRPKLPSHMSRSLKTLAGWSHFLMYLVLICMPSIGWIGSTAAGHPPNFWWLFRISAPWVEKSKQVSNIAFDIHYILAWVIVGLVVIHILAAIRHHCICKDDVLRSMIPCHKSF